MLPLIRWKTREECETWTRSGNYFGALVETWLTKPEADNHPQFPLPEEARQVSQRTSDCQTKNRQRDRSPRRRFSVQRRVTLERKRRIHPVIALEDLLAVESRQA